MAAESPAMTKGFSLIPKRAMLVVQFRAEIRDFSRIKTNTANISRRRIDARKSQRIAMGIRSRPTSNDDLREELIRQLNRGNTLDRAGMVITVPNVVDARPEGQVFRIEVDKPAKLIRAFGRNDELVAFYPASIGSSEKPAPSGTYGIRQVVKNPTYHYDPRYKFKGVRAYKKLTIAPGPNNPVGLVWIDLTKSSSMQFRVMVEIEGPRAFDGKVESMMVDSQDGANQIQHRRWDKRGQS
jgi:lipoprotein-anchoring transpeptidase ErfK/SrfK